MASIVLIAPTPPDISAFGVRSLSAYLRRSGHTTRLIFIPGSAGLLTADGSYVYQYDPDVIEQLADLCRGFDLIGVSFMTYYLDRAVQITRELKGKLRVPVIWGGIHATCKPEESLAHADMVCVGEGEIPLLSLLNNQSDIPGIWKRKTEGEWAAGGVSDLVQDLDGIPFCDFSNSDHYMYVPERKRILPMTDDLMKQALPLLPYHGNRLLRGFRIMADRGCPHHCGYCNVPSIKDLYRKTGRNYFRSRSVSHVIRELQQIRSRFPFVEAVQFFDDTFFARPIHWLQEFSELYPKKIGLPFYCQASPTTLRRDKLELLVNAGLVYVEMGIQTGSDTIRSIYNRSETSEQILHAAEMIHSFIPRLLPPDFHVIIDSPWETSLDLMDTVRLLYRIPKPYGLAISSLVFFPETELYRKAVADGFVQDQLKDIARKPFYIAPQKTYPHFLLYLMTFRHIPSRLIRYLMQDRWIRFAEKRDLAWAYKVLYAAGEVFRLADKGWTALRQGDFGRITSYFRKLRIHDPVVGGRKA